MGISVLNMKIFPAIFCGLALASDEEKFMKRELDYCWENKLSNQDCANRMRNRMDLMFEAKFTCALTNSDVDEHENHKSQQFGTHNRGMRALCDYEQPTPDKIHANTACTEANTECATDPLKQKCVMNHFKMKIEGACPRSQELHIYFNLSRCYSISC